MKIPRDVRPLVRKAVQQGWSVTLTRKCHLRWTNPEGRSVISASTPSDWRNRRNLLADLKRLGLQEGEA